MDGKCRSLYMRFSVVIVECCGVLEYSMVLHPHPPILEDVQKCLGVLYKVENYKGN